MTEERTERLLALLLVEAMKGVTLKEKVSKLNVAGFTNIEIAELLSVSPAMVATSLYETRKRRSAKGKRTTK